MNRRRRLTEVTILLLLASSGCSDSGGRQLGPSLSDSAGVPVVSVRPAEHLKGAGGSVVQEVGLLAGPEELQLARVSGALLLPDGRLVVANGGTKQLRFFDATGSFLFSVGGDGEGPGEYRSLDYLGLSGDTLVVLDSRLRRLSFLDLDGAFVQSFRLGNVTLPYVVGSTGSGRFTAWQFYGPEPEGLGVYLGRLEFGTIAIPEARFDVVGVADGAEEAQVQYGGRITRAFRPFSREGDVASGRGHIFVLESSADNRIRVHDAAGRLVRVIAVDFAREAPTPEHLQAWIESWMEEFQPPSQEVEDWWRFGFSEVPPPDSIPLLRSLEVDAAGNVCAERYPLSWDSGSRYWCFSPGGEFVGGFELPGGLVRLGPHPFADPQVQISEEHVVGVWADDLGVERVRVFELGPGRGARHPNGA